MAVKLDPNAVLERAEAIFDIPAADICGPRRFQHIIPARQAVAWALQRLGFSLLEIGKALHRSHTTIIYAIREADARAATNYVYAVQLRALLTTSLPEPSPPSIPPTVVRTVAVLRRRRASHHTALRMA
jgi:hypothetical protein